MCINTYPIQANNSRNDFVCFWLQGHSRSLRKLAGGTLRFFLNSEGEEEEQAETHSERMTKIMLRAQAGKGKGKGMGL